MSRDDMVPLWRSGTGLRPELSPHSIELTAMRIDGKVVIITGASEGIGAACAAEFARAGARLSLAARNEEGLHRAGGASAVITPGDLTDGAVRLRAVERTLERYGVI